MFEACPLQVKANEYKFTRFKNKFHVKVLSSSSISVSTWPCRGQEPGSIPGTGVTPSCDFNEMEYTSFIQAV